jgi:hypothetical protein
LVVEKHGRLAVLFLFPKQANYGAGFMPAMFAITERRA